MTTGYPTDPVADRHAQRWFAKSNPTAYVGSRHHTVPAFCLERFAEDGKRMLIWRRTTNKVTPGNMRDISITNFYTVLNTAGQFDGRMEEALGMVEGEAAPLVKLLLSALRRPRPLTPDERHVLCQLAAFQKVRGPRKRREIELLADYGWKTLASGQLSERDQRELIVVPHPNEHIRLMGPLSYAIYRSLLRRPVQIIKLDAPLLVISDEPVIIDVDDHVQHLPECSMTRGQLRKRQQHNPPNGTFKQQIHIWPTQPSGVEIAEAVGMPLSPKALLVWGKAGEELQPELILTGDQAQQLANEVNAAITSQAYDWIAARPDHPTFTEWKFPPPSPILGVCDGGSVMSKQLQTAPTHRWQRIRRDWQG